MVALLDATDKSYVAGGALIALHVVISVRQKIDDMNPEQLLVRAGEWDFKTETEHYRHVDAEVKQIVRHPDFDMDSGANNVALLFLKRSLKASIHINPICLPEGPKNFDLSRCIFTGWGKKSFEDFTHMNIMKKIELPVVQSSTCQHAISQYLGGEFVLHNSLMCAGGEKDKDSCMGDGGSPLACPRQDDPERYELAGLVNFGVQCGIPGVPGVYVNVANLMVGVSIYESKKVPLNKWLNYLTRYHLILISNLINSPVLIQPINKIYNHYTIDAFENVTI